MITSSPHFYFTVRRFDKDRTGEQESWEFATGGVDGANWDSVADLLAFVSSVASAATSRFAAKPSRQKSPNGASPVLEKNQDPLSDGQSHITQGAKEGGETQIEGTPAEIAHCEHTGFEAGNLLQEPETFDRSQVVTGNQEDARLDYTRVDASRKKEARLEVLMIEEAARAEVAGLTRLYQGLEDEDQEEVRS